MDKFYTVSKIKTVLRCLYSFCFGIDLAFSVKRGRMEVKNRECVLLRKEMVVYCKAYPIKKTIPYEKLSKSECRCFKPEYRNCEQYKKEFKAKKHKGPQVAL